MKVYRSVICTFEILEHETITIKEQEEMLAQAQESARKLYNFTRYCASYSRRIAYARECKIPVHIENKRTHETRLVYCLPSLKGKLPKYPGSIGMWKALHDTEEYKALNDRVSSYIIRGYDASFRSWFSNLKSNPRARPPGYAEKAPPLTFEVGRTAQIYDDLVVRLSVLPGSVKKRFIYGRIHIPPVTCIERVESIKILSDGRCVLSYKLDTKQNGNTGFAAIDLGIKRMVTIAFENGESIMYSGGFYLSNERLYHKTKAKCKGSGYKGKGDGTFRGESRKQKRASEKRNKKASAILHNMTASIINECKKRGVGTIVIGDLKGIRDEKNFGKKQNQQLHGWPFSKISSMIEYKAEECGIKVVKISERDTSKTCCICGNVSKSARNGRNYKCKVCCNELHADVNGAFNILKKHLAELGYSVSVCLQDGKTMVEPVYSAKFDSGCCAVLLMETGCKPVVVTVEQ